MRKYFVYIISNNSLKPLYIGVTNDIARRVFEHKRSILKGFTSKYKMTRLLWYEEFQYIDKAIEREKQLKNWHRQWKLNLIKEVNPNFSDLSQNID